MLKSILALTLAIQPVVALAAPHDVLILHGTVIDGTGDPRRVADVAIDNGHVTAIGDLSADTAKQTIDATKLIVAPGFIDVHTHVDDDIFANPLAENFVRDGVTTIVSGNCGGSVSDVGKFFERMKKEPAAVNHATLYGDNTLLRILKGGVVAGALTPEQIKKGQDLVDQAMLAGAIGFSTGLIYKPGTWQETEEICQLAKPVGVHGGVYATHMRSEGIDIMQAIDEALRVGKEAGCRVEISHFKISTVAAMKFGRGDKIKAGSDLTLAKVYAARDAGEEVWLDQYPYTASSTTLETMLPDRIFENGGPATKKLLSDPAEVTKVLAEMKHSNEEVSHRKDMSYAVVASANGHPEYNGKSIKLIAQIKKFKQQNGSSPDLMSDTAKADDFSKTEVSMEDQYRTIIDIYLGGGASMVFHGMDELEVGNILKSPIVGIASDSGIRVFGAGMPHPRGYGTNCRILGEYVRHLNVITLEDAVRKMTSLPAHSFRMTDRGTLKPGAFADVTMFDADEVSDKATYDAPHAYSVGVKHVLVNGVEVFDGNKMTGEKSGMPIYGPARVN